MNTSTTKNDYFTHPIFDPIKFRINTPLVEELKKNLTQLVWTGATGAALLGFTRAGKTTAIELITNQIISRTGHHIPVIRYSAHRRDQHTIRALYENMFEHIGLEHRQNQKTEALASDLLMHLAEKAKSQHVTQLIMMIDEAQRLAIPQIDLFAELDDRLRKEYSIALLCVFVGNEEQMDRLLNEVLKGENEHIQGRFFRQIFHFRGLRSINDVQFCLRQYDELRYPNNGPTYTEYFLPVDYKNGFRLVSLGDSVWRVFRHYQKEIHIKDWPLESFVRSVNTLLIDYLTTFGVDSYSADTFNECIKVSGLFPNVVIT